MHKLTNKEISMKNISWDNLRSAYQVALSGTLSAAGEELGVNHATVLRHINRLEEAIETKLFIRHQRGYRLTEAGQMLLDEMPKLCGQVNHLLQKISNSESSLKGDLIISTVSDFALTLNPLLKKFQSAYPQLRIQIIATDDRVPLVSGEAHVALRIAPIIDEPDLIAHHLKDLNMQLWASREYVKSYGQPQSVDELSSHRWVLPNGKKRNIPSIKKLAANIAPEQIIYQSNSFRDIHSAIIEGMGIGPVSSEVPNIDRDLVAINFPLDKTPESAMWFVYHRDLKENQRIKAFLTFIKDNINLSLPPSTQL